MIRKIRKKFNLNIRDEDNKELVRGGVSALVVRSLGIAFNYLFTFIVARGYGAAGSGIFAIFQSVLQVVSTIGKMGFDTLMMRSVAEYSAQNNWGKIKDLYLKTLWVTVPLSFLLSIILYFLSGQIAAIIFHKPSLEIYCKLAAFSVLPLVILGVHADGLRGMKKIAMYSFIEGGASIRIFACLLLGVSFLFYFDPTVPVITYIFGLIVTAIISIAWWLKKSKILTIIKEQINFSQHISAAFTLFLVSMLQIIRNYTNTIILGIFCTEATVGIFNVASRISTITSLTLTTILLTVAPKIAELYTKGNMKKMAIVTQNATKLIFWTSAPVLIIFILFPEFILGLFGEEFKKGWLVLIILSVGQFINAASGPVTNVLLMTGKQKIGRNILLIATVLTVALSFILVPKLDIVGAAVVNLISVGIINIVPMFIVKYYYGFYTIDFKSLFSFKLATEEKSRVE